MELHFSVHDFCVNKIISAASYAGIHLNVVSECLESDILKINPLAKSIVLKTLSGTLTQHTAILRYIAELCPDSGLVGGNDFESALVMILNILKLYLIY